MTDDKAAAIIESLQAVVLALDALRWEVRAARAMAFGTISPNDSSWDIQAHSDNKMSQAHACAGTPPE